MPANSAASVKSYKVILHSNKHPRFRRGTHFISDATSYFSEAALGFCTVGTLLCFHSDLEVARKGMSPIQEGEYEVIWKHVDFKGSVVTYSMGLKYKH